MLVPLSQSASAEAGSVATTELADDCLYTPKASSPKLTGNSYS
jgi:hypothetical protein